MITPKTTAIIILTILLLSVAAYAAQVSTTTVLYFNVATVVAFTNTLLGQAGTNAGSDTATTDVEFNSSSGTNTCVEAKVVGGTTQSNGNPVMSVDNTGTTNLNMTINLNATVPACMTLYGNTTYYAGSCSTGASPITTAKWHIVDSFTPAAAAVPVYLWTTFSACTVSDSTTRKATVVGNQT